MDASDLHLIMAPEKKDTIFSQSGHTAIIDRDKCTQFGLCRDLSLSIRAGESGNMIAQPPSEDQKKIVYKATQNKCAFSLVIVQSG